MSRLSKYTSGADRLGIISAIVCAVHCLVVPTLFLVKYSLTDTVMSHGAKMGDGLPHWWESLDYVFLFIGFIAVYHAAAHAAGRWVRVSLWFFWICLGIAVFFESTLHWMAYIASVGLIFTHFFNIRLHQKRAINA